MFKIGQKVVCKNIEGSRNIAPRGIKLREIYTIANIGTCICGKEILHLKDVPATAKWCPAKNVYVGYNAGFYSYRFEPLIGSWVEKLLEEIKSEFLVSV